MGSIIGIDFGAKRCGIASTDSMQIIASGLATVKTTEIINFLKTYCQENNVDVFVVGQPKRHCGGPSQIEGQIQIFINSLKQLFPNIAIERQDERFTSKIAKESLLINGVKKKKRQDKALVDKVSATLILQSYLTSKTNYL